MALDMTTALTIRAKVDGENQIAGLTRSLTGVTNATNQSATAMGRLKGAAAGAVGAMRAFLPVIGAAAIGKFAKDNLDAADAMSKLSQRTGIAAPTLDKFRKVAELSDTSIEALGKGFTILASNMSDAATKGKGPAAEAFKSLGISLTDANGKLLSTDQVMLQVADRFAKMEDGTEKAALASDIFGTRLGSQLIPLLNSGGDAVRKMGTSLTQDFADRAAKLNDQLENTAETLQDLGLRLTVALMPALEKVTTLIEGAANAFAKLPEPVQAITASLLLLSGLSIVLSPVISLLTSLGPILAGIPALLAGWAGAIGPLVSSLAPLGQILISIFTGPVGWIALAAAAGVAIYAFRDQIGAAFEAIGSLLATTAQLFNEMLLQPIIKASRSVFDGIVSIFNRIGDALKAPFQAAANVVRGIFNGVINVVNRQIAGVIGAINTLIRGANAALSRLRLPAIPLLPVPQVPAFAEGGVVGRPTLAMVGEGGEREYIIPESKMARASANYMAGFRGSAVLPGAANGSATSGTIVNIQTGPVLQQDGQQFVTISDLEDALQTMADTLLGNNRSTGGRRFGGVG